MPFQKEDLYGACYVCESKRLLGQYFYVILSKAIIFMQAEDKLWIQIHL